MCTFPNDVIPEYFAPTDPSGVRVDRAQRPELTTGTVEYLVPKEYWAKEPVGLRWLFVIDVSQDAVSKGFLEAFCEGILGALYGEDEDDVDDERTNGENALEKRRTPVGSKVGFVTFDKAMHFYNCNVSRCPKYVPRIADSSQESLERAQMLVMPDIEDPFVPLGSEGLFVDPYKSKYVSCLHYHAEDKLTHEVYYNLSSRAIASPLLARQKSRAGSAAYTGIGIVITERHRWKDSLFLGVITNMGPR